MPPVRAQAQISMVIGAGVPFGSQPINWNPTPPAMIWEKPTMLEAAPRLVGAADNAAAMHCGWDMPLAKLSITAGPTMD